jgi:hypothetical protein
MENMEINWESFKKWNSIINENSAVIAMNFLKKLTESYQESLSKIEEKYNTDKNKLSGSNATRKNAILENKRKRVDAINTESYKLVSDIKKLLEESVEEHSNRLEMFVSTFNRESKFENWLHKQFASTFTKLSSDVTSAQNKERTLLAKIRSSCEELIKQLNVLKAQQLNQVNFEADLEMLVEDQRLSKEMESILKDYKSSVTELDNYYKNLMDTIMSDEMISAYRRSIFSTVPSMEKFTCATTLPDYIYLGDASLEIAKKINILPEVTQLISYKAGKAISNTTPGIITATLPYVQRLEDGISLFINYQPKDKVKYQKLLKTTLLKLFMSFPPGKLEATMIDPLELGETFAMFSKLGEEQSRIIDTKIWSQEKDISESINILRQKLETVTQSYGDDTATRLRKEPIRVLAITDFPTGFTQNALRDLQAIVRKSAAYGVCILIWVNNEELAKLQSSQQSIFTEIKNMLHVASSDGDSLLLENSNYKQIYLRLDPMSDADIHKAIIINSIKKGIEGSQKKIERFTDMFEDIDDPNNWHSSDTTTELSIPIGIKGANTIVKMVLGKTDGSVTHHTLIAGQTGSGKSTLLHTIIMSTLLNYGPDEAQLYLVDFKEGVEFKTYSRLSLPSIKVVAIDCEREFGLNVLKELQKEMKRRFDLFKREADREEISEYRKIRGVKIPKLLVIFDEVQELFRESDSDNIGKACETLIGELMTLGRAAGIHLILASQNFNLIPSLKPVLFAHAAIRIAIKGSEDSAKSVLGDSNAGAKQLQDGAAGAAVFNDGSGKESANIIFQVAFLEKEKRHSYLQKLNAIYSDAIISKKYPLKTRILLTNAEDDIFNIYNQLILNKKVINLDEDETKYCLTVGDGFDVYRKFKIGIEPKSGSNLLMIGNDEKRAAAMFYFTILSLLYGELGNEDVRLDNQLIHLIDLSVEDEYREPENTCFSHLRSIFPNQVMLAKMKEMDSMISDAYETLLRRRSGRESNTERLFILIFGINRAHKLVSRNMYDDDRNDTVTASVMLNEIIRHGCDYGINVILWGETLTGTSKIIGGNIERDFGQRIAFSTDTTTLEQLVMEFDSKNLRSSTAIYMNIGGDDVKNTHFRPYEIPAKAWVDKIAKVYREFEKKEGRTK